MRTASLLVLTTLLLASCGAPAAQDNAAIPPLSDAWEEAFGAGDLDALVATYGEDAQLFPPGAERVSGHDGVRAAFGDMIAAGLTVELDTVEAVAAGDLGYHVGTYTVRAGDQVADQGRFLEIWRQTDGEWKITRDIWNSGPPAGAAPAVYTFTHRVEDPEVWLAAWEGPDGRRADFEAHGGRNVRVFQSPNDPKQVGLMVEVDDIDAMMAWIQSEEGQQAAKEDTVVVDTIRVLRATE